MKDGRRRHILESVPLMVLCAAAALYLLFAGLDFGRLEENLIPIRTERTADAQTAGEEALFSAVLDGAFEAPRSICFYSAFQNVRVRLDGRELYRFDKPAGERMMRAAPSRWNQVALPGKSAGSTLEIELYTPYRQYANVVPEVRAGSAAQIERYVALSTIPRFAAALAILFLGLIFAAAAVIMRCYVADSTGLYSLSLFIVVLAVFLAAQQTTILLEMYSGVSYILLQNVAFMLCPVLYTRYLMRVNREKRRRVALWLHAASFFNCALILALQLAGVRDMPQMMSFTRNLSAIIIAYVFVLEIKRRRRFLVCLYALLMIYAAFRYYFTDSVTWLVYFGLLGYLFLLLYRVVSSVVRVQAKQIRLEAALEVSRSEIATIQITSHFFYHTLDSIRALIRLDADRAYKMTGDFAKYVRHRVDGVERMQEAVPFSRELRSIRAYADIKRAQLGERFEMIYDIETEDFEILPLTVQPLVENAVIHAVQRRREGGRVELSCRETGAGYHIEVIDNGPGAAAPPEAPDAQKQSTAIRNVNTRLEFYGIAPLKFERNEMGGMTVCLDTPKKIVRKGSA